MSTAALAEHSVPWLERLRLTPAKLVEALVCTAVVLLPVLVPSGPANTGPVDLLILAAVCVMALDSLAYRTPIRIPYAGPVLLLVLAGGTAALYRDRALSSGVALAQDLVLLLWGATVASTGRDQRSLRAVVRVWVLSSVIWAAVLLFAVLVGLSRLAGISASEGGRVGLTFGDPNRAGSYFALSFLLLCAGWPSRKAIRWAFGAILLLALAYTGSNAAILSIAVALAFAACVRMARRHELVTSLLFVSAALLIVAVAASRINFTNTVADAKQSGGILANSVGRGQGGVADRELLVSETLSLYRGGDVVIGAGPGGTKALLQEKQSPYVKEAHNDYLAALLERGPLGALAVICLWLIVALRCVPLCSRSPAKQLLEVASRPEMIAAAALSIAVFGWFHEALHFRHVWAALGIVAAAAALARGEQGEQGGR